MGKKNKSRVIDTRTQHVLKIRFSGGYGKHNTNRLYKRKNTRQARRDHEIQMDR